MDKTKSPIHLTVRGIPNTGKTIILALCEQALKTAGFADITLGSTPEFRGELSQFADPNRLKEIAATHPEFLQRPVVLFEQHASGRLLEKIGDDWTEGTAGTAVENPTLHTRKITLAQDSQLTAEQLDDKYNPGGDGRHPIFGEEGWMQEVLQRHTLRGYWDWVAAQIEEELA
jgi:hypothetical protein